MIKKKKIAILGSTGSIGKTMLNIIKNNKNNFRIILLTADKNYRELLKQTQNFQVQNIIIKNKDSYKKFLKQNKNPNLKIYNNFKSFEKIFKSKVDYTMSSIVGIDGLEPTVNIIKYSKTIAIANKESIICGWNIIKHKLNKYKTNLIPVDSEHFSIWYAIKNINNSNISKIYLTASGGSLLNIKNKNIKKISIDDVLKHPNWKMGKKITIDSSTMMNKVFEIIEAKNIFNIELKKLSILIHPKSYIHAIIKFNDGMIKIIAHETTMEIPIYNSIYDKEDNKYHAKDINFDKLNNLNLKQINTKKFPLTKILNLIPKNISLFETILVAANDELVRLYLNKKIKYQDISKKLINVINRKEFTKYKKIKPKKISDIVNLDKYVRLKLNPKSV